MRCGYGDFLAQSDPELRQRQADSGGAPEGFADVVATLNPIADGQPELPAHWSVTFAVVMPTRPPGGPRSSAAGWT